VKTAEKLGFPVVLKLFSETITHKTDVGGVQLNIRTPEGVRVAWKQIKEGVEKHRAKFPLPARNERGEGKGEGGSEKGTSSLQPSPPLYGREGERTDASGVPSDFLGVTVQPMISFEGYELILGSSLDPQFGPVLLFGMGGQLVEVFKDRSLALPPLNATLARRMMEQTRIYSALKGVRGRAPINFAALEELLVRFSQLVVEQRWIAEIDINPLLASPERLLALDARVAVHGPKISEDKLPKPAIRSYPQQYVGKWKLRTGGCVTIRPIRPEDEPLLVQFHQTLSEETVYHRYFSQLKLDQRITHERLTRICFNDYDREIALVAERKSENGEREILGVGRLSKARIGNEAEFALLISDRWQRQGLGTELLERIVAIARDEKLRRVTAIILADNIAMQHVSRKVGFAVKPDSDHRDFVAEYAIQP
jgi:acetyltransferase